MEQLAQFPLQTFAAAAGKRLWMSEYASGNYDVADIRTGLDLSTQVSAPMPPTDAVAEDHVCGTCLQSALV